MEESSLYQVAIATLSGVVALLFGLYRKAMADRARQAEENAKELRLSNEAMRKAISELTTHSSRAGRH